MLQRVTTVEDSAARRVEFLLAKAPGQRYYYAIAVIDESSKISTEWRDAAELTTALKILRSIQGVRGEAGTVFPRAELIPVGDAMVLRVVDLHGATASAVTSRDAIDNAVEVMLLRVDRERERDA